MSTDNAALTIVDPPSSSERQSDAGQTYRSRENFERLQRASIMMVDDEPITMVALQSFLEEAGYRRFILVEDSVKAMEELREHHPDVLLLDVVMPEVSGFDILQALREDPQFQHLPVIILTSSADAGTKLKALDLGATDFLSKPVDPSELALRVRNTLAAKAYLDQLAFYDAVTGLPNRHLFQERLNWAVTRATREHTEVAVLHATFDDFKRIHETFGPKIGDNVLGQIASRLSGRLSAPNSDPRDVQTGRGWTDVFRVGSADFSVLLTSMDSVADVEAIGRRFVDVMQAPLDADGTDIYLLPSMGVAKFPSDAADAFSLAKLAIAASSQATTQDGSRLRFYCPEMNKRAVHRMRTEADLRRAIEKKEFRLLYQPKVDVRSSRIVGAEALIRWQCDGGKIVPPDQFIPIAEDTGLILPIGEWVFREACRQIVAWRRQGICLRMSINVSALQFFESDIVTLVHSILAEYGIEPASIILEMTESILVDDVDVALDILARLRTLGVKISIDDFGTGYSSLSYLKMFRADEVKIDRAFVADIVSSREDRALVRAITYLAHEMGFSVCAEGVEDGDQRDYLCKIRCDEYQGYFFSRPVSPEAFARLYLEHTHRRAS